MPVRWILYIILSLCFSIFAMRRSLAHNIAYVKDKIQGRTGTIDGKTQKRASFVLLWNKKEDFSTLNVAGGDKKGNAR